MSKIVTFISDTHTRHRQVKLSGGDILCVTGDFMSSGYNEEDVYSFIEWVKEQPYKIKVVISGNHDRFCESHEQLVKNIFGKYYDDGVRYIQDEMIDVEGLKIYGTPFQNFFCNWAFNIKDSDELSSIYKKIPEGLDILMTHCPPYDILDKSHRPNFHNLTGESPLGSKELKDRLDEMENPPKYHVFGHIHGDGGKVASIGETIYINASVCNEDYRPVNDVITLEI